MNGGGTPATLEIGTWLMYERGEKIVYCELNKLFSKRLNRILLMAMLLLAIAANVFAAGSMHYVDQSGTAYDGMEAARLMETEKGKWSGILTPKILSEATKEAQQAARTDTEPIQGSREEPGDDAPTKSYEDIEFMINAILSGDGEYDSDAILRISPTQAEQLYRIYEETFLEIPEGDRENAEKQDLLERIYRDIGTPFYYEAADSWKTRIMYAGTYGLMLVLVIGFLSAGIFSDEFQLRADTVFFSSQMGRTKATRNKLYAGLVMTTIVYWGAMLIFSAISFVVLGISGAKTAIQLEEPYSIYALTYGQLYWLVLLCGYIASLLSAAISMLLSAKSHSAVLGTGGSLALFCVSPFIGIASPFHYVFALTPDQLTNLDVCVGIPLMYEVAGLTFRQIPFIMALYTLAALVILPLAYRTYGRYVVK